MGSKVIHIDFGPDGVVSDQARIGPNSVLQTSAALAALEGPATETRLAEGAAIPTPLPGGMIPEAWFLRLVREVRAELPRDRAEAVLNRAGTTTAEYVARHRIPTLVRWLLRVLPARAGLPLLLRAIEHHAWTFAGAGEIEILGPYPFMIELRGCPTCRVPSHRTLSGGYYAAAFQGLLSLVSRRIRVREQDCVARGALACRFRIQFER